MRFTISDSVIRADKDRQEDGRGYYLCKDSECVEKAIKRKVFNRACRRNVEADEIRSVVGQVLNNN